MGEGWGGSRRGKELENVNCEIHGFVSCVNLHASYGSEGGLFSRSMLI